MVKDNSSPEIIEMKATKNEGDTQPPEKNKFFTPVMRALIQKTFESGQFFQMHPYTWNRATGLPEYVRSKWRLTLWCFNVALTFAHATFVTVRCIQINMDETQSKSKKVYLQFMAMYFLNPPLLQIAAILYGPRLPVFIQGYSQLVEYFQAKFMDQNVKKTRMILICEFFLTNSFCLVNTFTVMMTIGSYFRPASPENLTSLLDDPKSLGFLQKLPFMVYILYIEVIYHSHAMILFLMEIAFVFGALTMIDELNPKESKLTQESSLRNTENKFHMYNTIQIMVDFFNEVFASYFIPYTKVYLIIVIVMCAYGGIRLQGFTALTMGFMGISLFNNLVFRFILLSELHRRSVAVLEIWRYPWRLAAGSMREKRVVRSFTPLEVKVGSYYRVDRTSVLTMIEAICEQTVTFLLAYS